MDDSTRYSVRDRYGNIYGPATAELLRAWVREGRIIAGMSIRPADTEAEWVDIATHPLVADLFTAPANPAALPLAPTGLETQVPTELAYAPPAPRMNALAVASFVLGIVAFVSAVPSSFLVCCCDVVAIPAALAALATGGIALAAHRQDQPGKWMAVTGIVLAGLTILLNCSGFILFLYQTQWSIHA